jgi:hypothetical protein
VSSKEDLYNEVDLAVRSSTASPEFLNRTSRVAWLLPAANALNARGVEVREISSADPNSRTWQIDRLIAVLRKVTRSTGTLFLQLPQGALVPLQDFTIDPVRDSEALGWTEAQSLDLRQNLMLPRPSAAFRLTDSGPLAVIVEYSGYECSDFRIFLVTATDVSPKRTAPEPDFFVCVG